MLKVLLVTSDKDSLSALASALEKHSDLDLSWAESGGTALEMVSDIPVDLVVTDEKLGDMTGLELASRLLSINPMINCAAVSSLSHDVFQEASEGLGLLAQLSVQPEEDQAGQILQLLKKIKSISAQMNIDDS